MFAVLAPDNLKTETLREIKSKPHLKVIEQWDRLILISGPKTKIHFSQNIWLNPQWIEFESVQQGAAALKKLHKFWSLHPTQNHRRAQLIHQSLQGIKKKEFDFFKPLKLPPLGAWTLIEKNKILASPQTNSPFVDGELSFKENKQEPPSRAYLKLWEWFTRHQRLPHKNEICLDLGSSPGGWTWVLSELGCQTYSVDKAPLAPNLLAKKNVHCLKKDAFQVSPDELPKIDWLFSDIICEPKRLLEIIHKWPVKNMVLTLKFKGQADFSVIQEFASIKNSHIEHLSHNKHELTWSKTSLD
jgi:23S rRNA (cytidine2498-2'-O)-methyltransferase